MKQKEYAYQPMNATEFFLHEIARNTEKIAGLLEQNDKTTIDEKLLAGVQKEIEQIVEVKEPTKRTRKRQVRG